MRLGEESDLGWLVNILVMSESKLTSLIASPDIEVIALLGDHHASVLNCYDLLSPAILTRLRSHSNSASHLSHLAVLFDDDFITCHWISGALTIVIPTPDVSFTSTC